MRKLQIELNYKMLVPCCACLELGIRIALLRYGRAGHYVSGIPEDSLNRYETAPTIGKFVLLVHGSAKDLIHAKEIQNCLRTGTMSRHQ